MSMASYRNPWKLSCLLCATCEIGIALLLLLQIAFAFLVFQLMKHFCVNYGGIADMDGINSMKFRGYNTHIKEACVDDQMVSEEEEITPSSATDQQITSRCGYVASSHQESCKRAEDSDNITDGFDKVTQAFDEKSEEFDQKTQELYQVTQAFDEKTEEFDQKTQELDLGTQGFDECGVTDGSEVCSIKDRAYCCDHMDMVMRLEKAVRAEHVRLQSVYTELEEERSAAESAANEAMAMILRLQEEKSALLLKSAHFQRMAEEKAIHDEEAIRILEDNLYRKETECILLEEKIDELRAKSVSKTDMNILQKSEDCHYSYSSSLYSPLPGWHEVCYSKGSGTIASVDSLKRGASSIILESNAVEQGNVKSNTVDQINVERMEYCVSVMTCSEYLPLGADTIALHDSSSEKTSPLSTSEGSNHDNDATSALFQLSALEKQLQAIEARDLTLPTKESSKGSLESYGMEECESLPSYTSKSIAFNMEETEEEEKVVNIDVAQMHYSPSWEAYIPEDICQVHEENKTKEYQFQDSEACEEELKHLDVPSLVSSISPKPISNVKERIESEDYEGNWKFKRVTLEDIESRLQSLETQTLLLRHQSIPSTHSEHENMILLKEIRGLLNVMQSTPNLKGGKPRKCLFPEDSEKCLD